MAKGRVYCFLGPEAGEKKDAIEEIRRKLGKGAEETVFYLGETGVNEILSIIRNGSLFADARLFLIKNAELIKKKDDVTSLLSCLSSPEEDTVIILISDAASIDRNLEKKAEKRIFWELFEDRKTEWVASFFRREGYQIEAEGIEAILELVENNTDALRRECSRLMLFFGKEKLLQKDDVETWLSHSREESTFTLFSRIASGNVNHSVETLRTLLGAKESPQAIIAGLAWGFRKFRDYLSLTRAGIRDEFEFKKIGLGSAKVRKDYAALGRRYDSADGLLALLGEFDILVRSQDSQAEPILMDMLISKLTLGTEKL